MMEIAIQAGNSNKANITSDEKVGRDSPSVLSSEDAEMIATSDALNNSSRWIISYLKLADF